MTNPAWSLLRTKSKAESQSEVEIRSSPNGHHGSEILAQQPFLRALYLERRRTERSQRPFVLMLVKSVSLLNHGNRGGTVGKVLEALSRSIRETDIVGWYKTGSIVGVIYTEIGGAARSVVTNALLIKVTKALCDSLGAEQMSQLHLSFHVFPEDWEKPETDEDGAASPELYPDLKQNGNAKKSSAVLKRTLDIVGSLSALIVLLPILVAIGIVIKLTSEGPILFRQVRLGRHGRKFTFLKFRSMYYRNDHTIHKEYVQRFISGSPDVDQSEGDKQVHYKLKRDPRITPVGAFLRRTSLDELPQFFNVLIGQMSLVGPRPPLPYEYECYNLWHKRRLFAVKPGITGLWQVRGRSRTKFDEMVRLDLQYATSWSLWLDIRILLATPGAVVSGAGAG